MKETSMWQFSKDVEEEIYGILIYLIPALQKNALGLPDGSVGKNPLANMEVQVPPLVKEDLTCREATKPIHHNY